MSVGWRISSRIRWDQVNIRVPANNVSCLIRLEILEPTPRYIVIRRISEIDLLSSNSTGDPWNFDTSTYLPGDSLRLASSFSSHSTNRDISETALPITKTKNGDHFYRPDYPRKPGKTRLRTTFGYSKVFFFTHPHLFFQQMDLHDGVITFVYN